MKAKPSFYIRIYGGLGNQMFQYAVGRALAERHGALLKLDLRYFQSGVAFKFGLSHFHTSYVEAEESELPPDRRDSRFKYRVWRALRLNPKLVQESGRGYNAQIMYVRPGSYLMGYWQSERYFAEIESIIRTDFSLKEPASASNANYLSLIAGTNAVSLHVRRGDYANDPKITATHGLCSPDYYRMAVSQIMERVGKDITLFVFSDEPDWAEANLVFPCDGVIVRGNTADNCYEDMRLMSACRHHIIANSSFSWWSAWLNPSSDKVVIAPKRWLAASNLQNPDICPESWLRI